MESKEYQNVVNSIASIAAKIEVLKTSELNSEEYRTELEIIHDDLVTLTLIEDVANSLEKVDKDDKPINWSNVIKRTKDVFDIVDKFIEIVTSFLSNSS